MHLARRPVLRSDHLPEDLHPVLRRIYAARHVSSAAELDYSLQGLLPFTSLLGMERAVALLAAALRQQKCLLIIADYDADGATACAVAMRGLGLLGFEDVHFLVPNRFAYGYGLSPEIVEAAAELGPDLIITVDNGIASSEGVALARKMGMEVLITDHHLPGAGLPGASAIVNPNQPGDNFPSKHLSGVGVMFYILVALRSHLRAQNWFATRNLPEPNLAVLLDLVALGTVADVVPLDRNNRILVAQGLKRIRSGRCCAGISALLAVANRALSRATTQDLSYAVAPRLNAAGRLTDMALGIECLVADEEGLAQEMAQELDQLNKERRDIQTEMQVQAEAHLDELGLDEKTLPNASCLYHPLWHPGVVGVLAGRLKERLHRPVIVFARDKEGLIKGSARSIAGVHIRDVLETIANRHPDLIEKFGGHAMAAGLTLHEAHLERFRALFHEAVTPLLTPESLQGTVYTDGSLATDDLGLELAEQIAEAGPWGQGFPEPLFDGEFLLQGSRVVGERHLKLDLRTPDRGRRLGAIAFNCTGEGWPQDVERVRLAYRLGVNDYGGRRELQLVVEHIVPLKDSD